MSAAWNGAAPPASPPFTPGDWWRIAWRGAILGFLTMGALVMIVLVRLIERPICGLHRPVTPHFAQIVSRLAFIVLRIDYRVTGRRMTHRGAVVSNHASWMDIFSLNARKRIYFVSKAEVASWPGIGWLARATGTVFIHRDPRHAKDQKELFEARLAAGHKLLFFPEGTSTDGLRVLPFKSTLFAAFFTDTLRPFLYIQPVTLVYRAPPGEDPRFYGWWGEMEFGAHLLRMLAQRRQGSVEVIYHAPLKVSDFDSRKDLARACETAVRGGLASAGLDQG
ncbi:lysophospholipid acyltransferase family protein [Actibacterium sp. XHP0104]|uniref:lysophospholipid acyltransferase family protein n=1 Tax=Actibacterium sp. XHP0104 TaxID=2984335 RepID=UPI0021E839CA|nr:lysophospholipid acyltransferase family protein [Actibacterium sp. XHP0104]MCV2881152.1 1-acyl-sn-glycerol-3-phosphate acyltransferase [Actibacterium sp. XHP0104]